MTTTAKPLPMAMQIDYADLYARWEKGNWRSTGLDFTQDKVDWRESFSDFERRAALWNYALFFHGEESVAENLSPYIDAAPHEEQKHFLTTQQVDEARHAIFFDRFMKEVVEIGNGSVSSRLDATERMLTWGFKKTFEYLDEMADRLRKDRSRPQLAAAITLYHLVIEAAIAQTGQHFIDEYLKERGVLPGFSEGMGNVALDEQRHIAFGVRCLYDLNKEDPDCAHAVAETLREVTPLSVGLFVPPGWDERYITTFGATLEEVYTDGTISLESKLRAAGMPVEELPGPQILPIDVEPAERSRRIVALLRAGYLGEKLGPPSRNPDDIKLFFEVMGDIADHDAGSAVLQWDFKDADPWYLRVDNGSTAVKQGTADDPDVTLRCSFEDWIDIAAGREDPRRLLLRGKLRPKGNPARMWKVRGVFGR